MARLVQNRIQRHWFIEQMSEAELAQLRSVRARPSLSRPISPSARPRSASFITWLSAVRTGRWRNSSALYQLHRTRPLRGVFGYVHRRQGQWERCLDELKRSLEQDPRNAAIAANFANTFLNMRACG